MDEKFSSNVELNSERLFKIDENHIEIDLDVNNVNKIMMQILYYIEHGNKTFVINYSIENFKMPIKKVLGKLKVNNLYRLVKEYGVRIYFKGLPRCVYEKKILKPGIRWYFENKITHIEDLGCNNKEHVEGICDNCYSKNFCLGICKDYVEKYGVDDFVPMFANDYLYDFNLEEVENFNIEEMKDVAKEVLLDFKVDRHYMRKKFVFTKVFIGGNENYVGDRFLYLIYNRKDDFEKTYEFLKKYFPENILDNMKDILEKANSLILDFDYIVDGGLRKSLYFNINDLPKDVLESLIESTGIDLDRKRLWGVGVTFYHDGRMENKVFYDYEHVKANEIKDFVSVIDLESKRSMLRFANSLIKPVSNVFLVDGYKGVDMATKRIIIDLESNVFKLNQFAILFNLNLGSLTDKQLTTVGIELADNAFEKIDFAYMINPSYGIEEEEEENKYYYSSRY